MVTLNEPIFTTNTLGLGLLLKTVQMVPMGKCSLPGNKQQIQTLQVKWADCISLNKKNTSSPVSGALQCPVPSFLLMWVLI